MVYEICHPLVMENPGAASYVGYNCSSGSATVVMANCGETSRMANGLGTVL